LHKALHSIDALREDIDLIADTHARISDFFTVIVVGEFNAGKSTFINSLLGSDYLKSGILPTTDKVCILRHGAETQSTADAWKIQAEVNLKDFEVLDLPIKWLDHVAIIDTPGTNAIIKRHEQLTTAIVPRSDLVLFVTSAERPMTESEKLFLDKIKNWGKKVIIVVNKIDLLNEDEKNTIMSYVVHNATSILGSVSAVPVFAVSGRLALKSKMLAEGSDPAAGVGAKAWHESQLGPFEDYLKNALGKEELIKGETIYS